MSLLFAFFFFKQKTAYEMRISDWSSDVCSSDLNQRRVARAPPQAVDLRRVIGKFVLARIRARRGDCRYVVEQVAQVSCRRFFSKFSIQRNEVDRKSVV